jgi:hypothetical protein
MFLLLSVGRKYGECMKTLNVLTKAGHSLAEDRPEILECLEKIASHDGGQGGDGAWLVVCIDDDSMYDIAVSVITQAGFGIAP